MSDHLRFGLVTALVAALVLVLGGHDARPLGGFLLLVGVAVVIVNLIRQGI
jgi:hypothetical protein